MYWIAESDSNCTDGALEPVVAGTGRKHPCRKAAGEGDHGGRPGAGHEGGQGEGHSAGHEAGDGGAHGGGGHVDPVAPVLLALTLVLVGAKLGGDAFERMGQPAVLGELIIGLVLGNAGFWLGHDLFTILREGPVINDLAERGCEAVVLGCTEIPLIVTSETSPLPLLDSTRLLARGALRASLA